MPCKAVSSASPTSGIHSDVQRWELAPTDRYAHPHGDGHRDCRGDAGRLRRWRLRVVRRSGIARRRPSSLPASEPRGELSSAGSPGQPRWLDPLAQPWVQLPDRRAGKRDPARSCRSCAARPRDDCHVTEIASSPTARRPRVGQHGRHQRQLGELVQGATSAAVDARRGHSRSGAAVWPEALRRVSSELRLRRSAVGSRGLRC